MDLRKVKKLIELLEESGLSEIEITEGDDKVRITKSSEEKQTTVVHTSNEAKIKTNPIEDTKSINNTGFHEVKAPMIGTFYQSPEPDAESL
jgi:Biotin carboxyl carrier protein